MKNASICTKPRRLGTSLLLLSLTLPVAASAEPTQAEIDKLIAEVDELQRNSGDWKTLAYIEQKEKDKNDLAYEAVVYRRDADDKLMILFLKPKAEAGKGYLRLDKNLEDLFNTLDRKVGAGNYVVFLSSDHGVADIPAELLSYKIPAGVLVQAPEIKGLTDFLKPYFGERKIIERISHGQVERW